MNNLKCILLLLIASATCSADSLNKDKLNELQSKIQSIREDQIDKYHCRLNSREAFDALELQLKYQNFNEETLKEIEEKTSLLIKGLRKVVVDKKSPLEVYKELLFAQNGISEDIWQANVKRTTTLEDIQNYEKSIPRNMKQLIEEGKKSFTPILENWLLEKCIIELFDKQNPDQKSLGLKEKLSLWWDKALKNYSLPEEDFIYIKKILSRPIYLNEKEEKIWQDFFAVKLEKFKNWTTQNNKKN